MGGDLKGTIMSELFSKLLQRKPTVDQLNRP